MKKRNQALNVKKSKKPANIADIFEKEEEKQEKAFLNNQYWRVPESFSIEDLLQDFEWGLPRAINIKFSYAL